MNIIDGIKDIHNQKRSLTAIRKKGSDIKKYKNYEENNYSLDEEIIGLDSNVLVDSVNSKEFRDDLKANVTFNVLKIYTTELALSEARNVLIKKKHNSYKEATERLLEIIKDFCIENISHIDSADKIGFEWVDIVKNRIKLKRFSTFSNDCKILSNLYIQKNINVYYTEDKDIKKAVEILGIKLNVRILSEATRLSGRKTTKFFRERY